MLAHLKTTLYLPKNCPFGKKMPQVHSDLDGSFLRKFHFGIFSVFCDADGSMLLLSPEFVSNAVLGFAPCPENSRPSHEH